MTATEHSAPAGWTTTDERFFKVVDGLFPPAFLEGSSVLLGSYDSEVHVAADSTPSTPAAPDTTPGQAPAYAVVRSVTGPSDLS